MNILFVCSEVAPFSKTGGLADVAGALPGALAALGNEVTVVTPLYRSIKHPRLKPLGRGLGLRFPFGPVSYTLKEVQLAERHRVVFIDQPGFFDRDGIYGDRHGDFGDNHRRFGFFSVAALSAAEVLGFQADVVHLNDWQSGLAAVALARGFRQGRLARAGSVFTVHNLAYQGTFSKGAMDDLGLPWELFTPEGLELYDAISFMKAGLSFSDLLTTVSPRYAHEIQTPDGGWGLDGVLRSRRHVLHGILNGVDYKEWNPETDIHLPAHYSAKSLSGKAECKRQLLSRFGLGGEDRPLFGLVGRLVHQKGIDLLLDVLPYMLQADVRFIALGSGEGRFEHGLHRLKEAFPHKVGVKVGFDNALSHLIEAGSDFFLMPSRFEPCGLNQLYSLRYGTVPIVRSVGGLEDTVVDLSHPEGTGIKFSEYSTNALGTAIYRGMQLYENSRALHEVRTRGMAADFSWETAARQYEALYRHLPR